MRRAGETGRRSALLLALPLAVLLAILTAPAAQATPPELTVTNTPSASWERSFQWSLQEMGPSTLRIFVGDTAEAVFSVQASATGTDVVTISGTVTVENSGTAEATITDVVASFLPVDPVAIAAADCNAGEVGNGLPLVLAPGDPALSCDYTISLASPADGTSVATVTCSECAEPSTGTASVTFAASPTLIGASAGFGSTQAQLAAVGSLSATAAGTTPFGPFQYSRTYGCIEAGASMHDSTVTLLDAGATPLAQAGSTLSLWCDVVQVSRHTDSSFTRTHEWEVEEYATHTSIILARKTDPGASSSDLALSRYARAVSVRYAVRAQATYVDGELEIAGYVDVRNPSTLREARVVSLTDDLLAPAEPSSVTNCRLLAEGDEGEDGGESAVSAAAAAGAVIPAGATLRCDYVGRPSEKVGRSETIVGIEQYHYPAGGQPQALGTQDYAVGETIDWGAPERILDARARVYSSHLGALGWAFAPGPAWFAYTLLIEPGAYGMPMCGNGATRTGVTVIGNDTESRSQNGVRIPSRVLCFEPALVVTEPGQEDTAALPVEPDLDPADAVTSTNATGRINGVKNEAFPTQEIVCTGGAKYRGKRGGKRDPAWALIGPKGQRTPFWVTGKKLTYAMVIRHPRKGRSHRLARVFAIAKLYALSGSAVDARTSRALVWSDRYFVKGKSAGKSKRAAARAQAQRQRKAIGRHIRVLKRFNKISKRRGSPTCVTGSG